jgi:hypothetical protein
MEGGDEGKVGVSPHVDGAIARWDVYRPLRCEVYRRWCSTVKHC